MPDWRKAEDYHFPATFPRYRWAWEFLRRNPDYRKDWQAALSRFLSKTEEFEEGRDPMADLLAGRKQVGVGEDWKEDPEDPAFYLPVEEAARWGLSRGLLNPATADPAWLIFSVSHGTIHYLREGARFTSRGFAYPIVEFDLHLPTKPQIDGLAARLDNDRKARGIKPRQVRHYRDRWHVYLRLLDAELDHRTTSQIADALAQESEGFADPKKLWDQLRAAKRMTLPEGYLSVFLS